MTTSVDDVCTLFEGDYHLGVAALLNSLYAGGFRGRLWVGYRGPLPAWLAGTEAGPVSFDGIAVRSIAVPDGWHLTHCKPAFMAELLRTRRPDAAGICYFDPDIVALAPWAFFQDWVAQGVALCEDCTFPRLPATHPFRRHWRAVIAAAGRAVLRVPDDYLNGGFVGVNRGGLPFLDAWSALMATIAALPGVDLRRLRSGSRSDPFCVPDQDGLNLAVMATDVPLSIVGPDGMGFTPGGFIMQHATSAPKPWRCRFTRRLLRTGAPPTPAEKAFWHHVRGVARPLSAARVARARADLVVALAVSRFYGK